MSTISDATPVYVTVSKDAPNMFIVGPDKKVLIVEAPQDGNQYVRSNGQWVKV